MDKFDSKSEHSINDTNNNDMISLDASKSKSECTREISDADSAIGQSEISPYSSDDDRRITRTYKYKETNSNETNSLINSENTQNSNHQNVTPVMESVLSKTTSFLDNFFTRVYKSFVHGPISPRHENIAYYKHLLSVSSTYEHWHAAAHQLDRLENNEGWKDDPSSDKFDYKLIMSRLSQLRRVRESGDIDNMIFLLRTSLSRNIGDIGNPALYSKTRVGTKKIIEDYIDEVIRQLRLICEAPEKPIPGDEGASYLSLEQKLEFFLNTRQSFGRTALLLSGGATLGLNHIGVIKTLHECRLLPRIISGSSIGSLMAALVCSKTDNELFDYLHDEDLNLNALESVDEEGNLFFKISRFIKHGVIFDVEVLKNCIRSNIGDVTFQDAYNRTRRILNITVSSSTKYEMPRLLNYLTAPNVLIWSAVAASCAIPWVYKSAPLMARDRNGNIVSWNPSGHRWIDGSVENDLPMLRLSELFNVNHFIVCQVNPHVVPFLPNQSQAANSPIKSSLLFLAKSELNHRLSQLVELDIFPTTLHRLQNIISQKYYGDITIVPEVTPKDYLQLISNPSKEALWQFVIKGERATWPQISIIKNHCSIELALDDIIYRLRCRKLEASFSSMMVSNVDSTSNTSHNRYGTIHNVISPGLTSLKDYSDIERPTLSTLSRSHSVGRGLNMQRYGAKFFSTATEFELPAPFSEDEFTAGSEIIAFAVKNNSKSDPTTPMKENNSTASLPLSFHKAGSLAMTSTTPDAPRHTHSDPNILSQDL